MATAIKLDDSIIFSWKAHTLANLRGYELLHFVDVPVDVSDSLAVQQDQLLMGWLFAALSPSILSQVATYTTSYDFWKALQNIFNAKSRSRRLQLRHEMSNMKKGGLIANQYLIAISQKADEVRDVGISIDDEELALFALDDLDSSYDAFVMTITGTMGEISFFEFKGLLRAHKKRTLQESLSFSPTCKLLTGFGTIYQEFRTITGILYSSGHVSNL